MRICDFSAALHFSPLYAIVELIKWTARELIPVESSNFHFSPLYTTVERIKWKLQESNPVDGPALHFPPLYEIDELIKWTAQELNPSGGPKISGGGGGLRRRSAPLTSLSRVNSRHCRQGPRVPKGQRPSPRTTRPPLTAISKIA